MDNLIPTHSFLDAYTQALSTARDTITQYKGLQRRIVTDQLVIQLYEAWVEKFGFTQKQIREHLDWKDVQIRDVKTSWTMREILEGSDYVPELVPSLIPKGALLLWASDGKVGKTSTLIDLIYGVSVSGEWLGLPVERGKVIQYDLEQGRNIYKRKILKRGFSDPSANHLRFNDIVRVEKKFNILEDIDKLREYIYEFEPKLVTFDSVRKILAPTGISENSAEAGGLLYLLQDICIETGVTMICLHHCNKSKGTTVGGSISGSNAFLGANDGVFKFSPFKNNQGQYRVKLETLPREGLQRSLIIKMNRRKGGRYNLEIEEELNILPEVAHIQGKLIRTLSQRPHRKYVDDELLKDCGGNFEHYQTALDNLQEYGIVYAEQISEDRYLYFIPEESPFFDDTNYLSKYITVEARLADELVRCSTRQEVRLLTADWDSTLKSKVFALLSEKEQQLVKDLLTNCPYTVGQDVIYNGIILTVQEYKLENKTYWFRLSDYEDWVCEDDLGVPQKEVYTIEEKFDPQDTNLF